MLKIPDKYKHRLFTVPWRITTNNNKDIVVVDRTSDYTGRVVVVGWEGDNIIVSSHMDSPE
jgi:hypothetical protein